MIRSCPIFPTFVMPTRLKLFDKHLLSNGNLSTPIHPPRCMRAVLASDCMTCRFGKFINSGSGLMHRQGASPYRIRSYHARAVRTTFVMSDKCFDGICITIAPLKCVIMVILHNRALSYARVGRLASRISSLVCAMDAFEPWVYASYDCSASSSWGVR